MNALNACLGPVNENPLGYWVGIAQIVTAAVAVGALILGSIQAVLTRTAVRAAADQAETTRRMADDQRRLLEEDLKMRLLLHYEDRFESSDMQVSRSVLADRLLSTRAYRRDQPVRPEHYDIIRDDVPGFFESLGTIVRRQDLDVESVWIFFDHYARHYWAALAPYVAEDRSRHGEDIWEEFQGLVRAVEGFYQKRNNAPAPEIDEEDVVEFLKEESVVGR